MDSHSTSPGNHPEQERSNEYWTGVAFLPIGITFLVLGFTNTTYLAIGLPFLILAFVMMGTKGKGQPDTERDSNPHPDDENPSTGSTDTDSPR